MPTLVANTPEYGEVWRKTFGKFPVTVMDDQQWFDHDISMGSSNLR
jgi:hypothetical protein